MARRVLVTGAAGKVAAAFLEYAGARYDLRLTDRDISRPAESPHTVVQADLADPAVCLELCAGMDTVLHLAADPSPRADFYGSLLDNNVKAVYNIFRAAADQGCRRVIFASSIQTIEGYPLDVQVGPEQPPKPMNLYAACKLFGEHLAHYFAHVEGLSALAVRIGAFGANDLDATSDGRTLSAYISRRDLSHLFVQCIETPDVQFAILHAISDNRFKRLDIRSTREAVGYAPRDDAFRRFGIGIQDTPRWEQEYGRGAQPPTEEEPS